MPDLAPSRSPLRIGQKRPQTRMNTGLYGVWSIFPVPHTVKRPWEAASGRFATPHFSPRKRPEKSPARSMMPPQNKKHPDQRAGVVKQFYSVLQGRHDLRVTPSLFHQFIQRDKAHEIITDTDALAPLSAALVRGPNANRLDQIVGLSRFRSADSGWGS